MRCNVKFILMAVLLSGCSDGDDSKIVVPYPDVNIPDVALPDPGYFCGVCKMYNGCNPKADASISSGDASIDLHKTCQEIGACGSACADGGHK
jgi:hypothetical protein